MNEEIIIDCPCRSTDRHSHTLHSDGIPTLVATDASLNISDAKFLSVREIENRKGVYAFYYTCGKSKHHCKTFIDTKTGEQLQGECEDCH